MNLDQISFETVPDPEIKQSSHIQELFTELENPPQPVDTSRFQEPENTEQPPEANTSPQSPSAPDMSKPISKGRKTSASLFMKGFDTLFAGAGAFVTDRPEKFDFYKAAERDLNELSEMLGQLFEYYQMDPAPWIPFALGLGGIYGTKTLEIHRDFKNRGKTVEQLREEKTVIEEREQAKPVIKPERNKGGRPPGSKSKPGSKKTGPKAKK